MKALLLVAVATVMLGSAATAQTDLEKIKSQRLRTHNPAMADPGRRPLRTEDTISIQRPMPPDTSNPAPWHGNYPNLNQNGN